MILLQNPWGFLGRHIIFSVEWYGLDPESRGPAWWFFLWGLPQIPHFIISSHDISSNVGAAKSCSSSIRASYTVNWICCRAISCSGILSKLAASHFIQYKGLRSILRCVICCHQNLKKWTGYCAFVFMVGYAKWNCFSSTVEVIQHTHDHWVFKKLYECCWNFHSL